jgi:uncharacterized protein
MLNRRAVLSLPFALAFSHNSLAAPQPEKASKLVAAAKSQIGVTKLYDPAYVKLKFPGGDVARDRGVCTDVVIRAYRDALGLDLQSLMHADMAKSFNAYPKRWGLKKPDRNIDHRRVPNLQVFFARAKAERSKSDDAQYLAGDLVTMMLPGNLPHIGIIADERGVDERGASGQPLLIHNIGGGTQMEDRLLSFPITGHYRYGLD